LELPINPQSKRLDKAAFIYQEANDTYYCPLTAEDAAHGIVSDRTGYFPGSPRDKAPHLLVREIVIVDPARPGRAIRLITDLLELPAHIIGLLYQQRSSTLQPT
jgi:hypothetical protein